MFLQSTCFYGATIVAILPAVTALPHILFPLYIYPNSTSWQPLYNSLAAYPDVTVDVVINPGSGPTEAGYTTFPYIDSNWEADIAQLHTYPNANLLGYVHTSSATRDINDVESDIEQYANWATYTGGDISMDGIFFDEAPSVYSTDSYNYMSTASSYAKSLSLDEIVFNPGVNPDTEYYALANYIVAFEDYASNFATASITDVPAEYRPQAVFILHDFDGTAADQASIVEELESYGVGGVFISTVAYYDFSALWDDFVSAVAAG